jgi:hypothetical protein
MPFQRKVTVPRITAGIVADFEALVPGLSGLVKIPVITTTEDVEKAAKAIAEKQLTRYEYVRDVEDITKTATGWVVTLNISGD